MSDVPRAPARRAAARGARAPSDLPGWLEDMGEPGGMRFRLIRLEPGYRDWPPTRSRISHEEIERHGPGIYEIQTERVGVDKRWRPYGAPRQVVLEAPAGWPGPWAGSAAPGAPGAPAARRGDQDLTHVLVSRLLERLDGTQVPHNPYSLPGGGTAVPADTVDELRAGHREQVTQIRTDASHTLEAQRMLWEDRLEAARANAKASESLAESRVRELEARVRRLEGELAEAKAAKTDPIAETLRTMEQAEKLKERFGGGSEDDGHWMGALLRNPDAVGSLLDKVQNLGLPGTTRPATPAAVQALPAPAPGAPEVEDSKRGLVEALEHLYRGKASADDVYAALAPNIGPEALKAGAGVPVDRFVADLVRPSSQASPLRDPEAAAWLASLHRIVVRLHGAGPAPEPAQEAAA